MSQNNSPMDLINQYFQKLVDRINSLESENSNLKSSIKSTNDNTNEYEKLKRQHKELADRYDNLVGRHNELKAAYAESENQVKELDQENERLVKREKQLNEQITNSFEKLTKNVAVSSCNNYPVSNKQVNTSNCPNVMTPKKESNNQNVDYNSQPKPESQKVKHQEYKATTKPKFVLKSMYESDSESDDSEDEHELQKTYRQYQTQNQTQPINNTVPYTEMNLHDQSSDPSIEILKRLIGNDLWNHIEASVNTEPNGHTGSKNQNQPQTQPQNQNTKPSPVVQQQPQTNFVQQPQSNKQFNRAPGYGRPTNPINTNVNPNTVPPSFFSLNNDHGMNPNDKPSEEELAFFTNLMSAMLRSPMGGKK